MTIAIITPIFPYPLVSGGHKAQFYIIDALRKHHKITIYSYDVATTRLLELQRIWPNVKFKIYSTNTIPSIKQIKRTNWTTSITSRIRTISSLTLLFKKIAFYDPNLKKLVERYTSSYKFPRGFENYIRIELKKNSYDLIQFEFVNSILIGAEISKYHKNTILVHHELGFIRNFRVLKTCNWKSRIFIQRFLSKEKQKEIQLINHFNKVIVFSQNDKNILLDNYVKRPIFVSPFPVNDHSLFNLNETYIYNKQLIYIGAENHYPNRDAMNWFLNKVWFKIKKKELDLNLTIIGKWEILPKLYNDTNLYFSGYVDSYQSYFQGSIMIIPLRIGSGIRNKILEAFVAGVPVISTSIGIEGIPAEPGKHYLEANNSIEFIEAIKRLSKNKQLQKYLSKNAKIFVNKYYGFERCYTIRKSILEKELL